MSVHNVLTQIERATQNGGVMNVLSPGGITMKAPGTHYYVDSTNGVAGFSGLSWGTPMLTITEAVAAASAGDIIWIIGTFTEAVVITTNYLTFIGAGTYRNQNIWMEDSAGDTLATVTGTGCRFVNIRFRVPTTGGTCLAMNAGSDYFEVLDCKFQGRSGSYYGIHVAPTVGNWHVQNCEFTFINTATYGCGILSTGTSGNACGGVIIEDCIFHNNLRHIDASLRGSVIRNNIFMAAGIGTTGSNLAATVMLDTYNGGAGVFGWNSVFGNQFGAAYNETELLACDNDQWAGNYTGDVSETEVGASGITLAVPEAD